MTDLNNDIIEKFTASGSSGVGVPGAWGGIPWIRTESADSTNGITNPHGVWFNGQDVYIGGLRGGNAGTYRYNQQGQYQATLTNFYRLTNVTVGNYIYYGQDSFVSCYSLSTEGWWGTVNLNESEIATTWGISIGRDGYLYVDDNYQSSTFPDGNAVRGSGHIYRIDHKPSTFTNPATLSYNPFISGLDDMTGIDTADPQDGNIYVVELHLTLAIRRLSVTLTVKKFSPAGVLIGRYDQPTPLDQVGPE